MKVRLRFSWESPLLHFCKFNPLLNFLASCKTSTIGVNQNIACLDVRNKVSLFVVFSLKYLENESLQKEEETFKTLQGDKRFP